MVRRKQQPPSDLPPPVTGMYRGGAGRYVDDAYALTPEGKAYQDRLGERRAREHEEDGVVVQETVHERLERARERARLRREASGLPATPVYEETPEEVLGRAAEAEARRLKRIDDEEARSGDPRDWVRGGRMTATETSIRLARYLVREGHVTGDVRVSLTGRELTRTRKPLFPVEAFLKQMGFVPVDEPAPVPAPPTGRGDAPLPRDWRATYRSSASPHGIVLTSDRRGWEVAAPVADDMQLLVTVGGGTVQSSRGAAEHESVHRLIGRALKRDDIGSMDLLIVAVPRSPRTRRYLATLRESRRLARAGVSLCIVDRAGAVHGLPFLDSPQIGEASEPSSAAKHSRTDR